MPNKRKHKPPKWEQATPGKVYVLEVNHDDGCPTILSQRIEDCTCPHVESSLREIVKQDD